MKEEISAAASFLTRLVGKNEELSADQVQVFQSSLGVILMEKFQGHWFPEKPCRGQAYRCIRVNGRERRDPVLEQAAEMCGLRYENLKLPVELTVWVDPLEVCCRFGEDEGSYCTVASFKENKENLSDNIVEESHLKCNNLHQTPSDCQKKQKNRRKPSEKQKKQGKNPPLQPLPPKGPKMPLIPSKGPQWPPAGYFEWTPTRPYSARFSHLNPFQDMAFNRRPKKAARSSAHPNDRFHWARK